MSNSKSVKNINTLGRKGVNVPPPINSLSPPPFISVGDINLEINLSPIHYSILKYIIEKVTLSRIAKTLSKDRKTIKYHLEKLEEFNLVTYSGAKFKSGVWRITNEGKQVLRGVGRIKKQALTCPPQIVNKNRLLVSQSESKKRNLTELEMRVLSLLKKGNSQNSIALQLDLSRPRVSKIKQNIERKIAIENLGGHRGAEGLTLSPPHEIRLHKEQWKITILAKSPEYDKLSKFHQNLKDKKVDKNTVKTWSNVIEVYSNTYFLADTPKEATSKALDYWNNFFKMLELKFKIKLLGNDSENIKRVRCEYAELNNELSKSYNKKDIKVKIYSKSGKLWALFDNSFNLSEAETVNNETAETDLTTLTNHFNDIRDNEVLLPSQFQELVNSLIHTQASFQSDVKTQFQLVAQTQFKLDQERSKAIESLAVSTGNLAKVSSNHELILSQFRNPVVEKSTDKFKINSSMFN